MAARETSDDLLNFREARVDWSSLGILTGSHFASDFYQGAVSAMLPFLVLAHDISLSTASLFVLAFTVSASSMQPGFGWLADRADIPWLLPGGLLLSGIALSLVGQAGSLWTLLLLSGLCGCGGAAFHPTAARAVTSLHNGNSSLAMSIFMLGGQAGFACGPLFAGVTLSVFGMSGAYLLIAPALIAAGLALFKMRDIQPKSTRQVHQTGQCSPGRDLWPQFAVLATIVFCWSIVSVGIYSYLALYWTNELNRSPAAGNMALTLMLIAGIGGMLLGSWIADRSNRPIVVTVGMICVLPAVLLMLGAGDGVLANLSVIPVGIALYGPFAVMIVLGQRYLPSYVGMASGVTMGLSMSIGGLTAPLIGSIADEHGFTYAFLLLAGVSLVAGALSLGLAIFARRPLTSLALDERI